MSGEQRGDDDLQREREQELAQSLFLEDEDSLQQQTHHIDRHHRHQHQTDAIVSIDDLQGFTTSSYSDFTSNRHVNESIVRGITSASDTMNVARSWSSSFLASRNSGNGDASDNDDSNSVNTSSSARSFPSRVDLREVDQSINLMDCEAAHYEYDDDDDDGVGNFSRAHGGCHTSRHKKNSKKKNKQKKASKKKEKTQGRKYSSPSQQHKSARHEFYETSPVRALMVFVLFGVIFLLSWAQTKMGVGNAKSHGETDRTGGEITESPTPVITEPASHVPISAVYSLSKDQPEAALVKNTPIPESSSIPIPAERTDAFQKIYALQKALQGSDRELLKLSQRPHAQQAITWMTSQDSIAIQLLDDLADNGNTDNGAADVTTLQDALLLRYSLAIFYFSTHPDATAIDLHSKLIALQDNGEVKVTDPNDNRQRQRRLTNTAWMSNTHVCHWQGVRCNGNTDFFGLDLAQLNLQGTIPPEWSYTLLPFALQVDLSHNQLSGELPQLHKSGTATPKMEFLSMTNNSFTGPVPSYLANKNSKLYHLDLSHNELVGNLAVSSDLVNLQRLYMHGNQISGTLPDRLFQGTTAKSLVHLRMGDNQLTGSLPASLKLMTSLRTLQCWTSISMPCIFAYKNARPFVMSPRQRFCPWATTSSVVLYQTSMG